MLYNKVMRYGAIVVYAIIAAMVVTVNVPLAAGKDIRTEEARIADITGTFTLILYGGRFSRDVETVAFLDPEGDKYTLEPYAPDFDFRVIKGLSAKEASDKALHFVKAHFSFWTSQLSRILDDNGRAVGFELRPLYDPLTFGNPDVMDINYSLKGDKIRIYIKLKPDTERRLFGGGSIDSDR
ncbi:MAG TPA: hypothetical protein VN328_07765 [Thermodesulfovibrionales bacterium]|nr:hypothetical protein [Thermodesulfovibrionales bacterium]